MFRMLGNIIRNLFSKPATRKYPQTRREPFENARGCIDIDISNCIFCGICQKKCPADAIKVSKDGKSWEIDPYKCIICNVCTESCPKKCILSNPEYKAPEYQKSINRRVKE